MAHVGDRLVQVWLYGSAARAEMWADFWPMRSDIDLLIVTSSKVDGKIEEGLRRVVYERSLGCGRRIDMPIRTRAQLRGQWASLWSAVQRDGICLWPRPLPDPPTPLGDRGQSLLKVGRHRMPVSIERFRRVKRPRRTRTVTGFRMVPSVRPLVRIV